MFSCCISCFGFDSVLNSFLVLVQLVLVSVSSLKFGVPYSVSWTLTKTIFWQYLMRNLCSNSCLLSAFGAVIALATICDLLSTESCRRPTLSSVEVDSEFGDHDNVDQTPVYGQETDVPLILTFPAYRSTRQRVSGSCILYKYLWLFTKSRPNNMGLMFVRTSVHKKFFRFQWNLVCR